jgi:tetratricopeptide (TPR) repeat protein
MRPSLRPPVHFSFLILLLTLIFTSLGLSSAYAQTSKDLFEQAAQYFYDGKYDQAISNYERIIETDPNFAPAYNALGLALKMKGAETSEVAFYLKKAMEIDHNFTPSYDNLGKLYYSTGDMDQAEDMFTKGLALDPNNESMKLSMGWVYLLGRNNPDKAMKYFKTVVGKGDSAMGYFGLGICYMAGGKRMEVMDIVTKLREINQESLAQELETMMRENRSLVLDGNMPTASSIKTVPKSEGGGPAKDAASDASTSMSNEYNEKGELQVRLRGKLHPD